MTPAALGAEPEGHLILSGLVVGLHAVRLKTTPEVTPMGATPLLAYSIPPT
jgi:hypothetical protein